MTKLYTSEEDLIKACKAQNTQAQFFLFENYKIAMFNLIYRICNDYDQANDHLQEGFIEVFRNIKNFREESTLGAWIKSIMIRKTLKGISSKIKFEKLNEQIQANDLLLDQWIDGEMLDKAIRNLPESSRTVFVLYEIEGYSHDEISKMLKVSTGTSKSQLHYAKKILQKSLSKN
ncbi:sigma-70 family RNA polymerase sigma factor [Belliella sp. DSM 111904]|uniref:Sigma-70 family RNA polymerase sigma factor n=1 Tax=Belliella filtrata TaxID=2923435 RepID=A0ABS9V554_9BACT|nr:sigma-70 family RNA polymerase sigma factor [Belliella filtrata]MCH7411528.1 sigma-70 family RNA polymerase sigma factor [Belliella filtrata]